MAAAGTAISQVEAFAEPLHKVVVAAVISEIRMQFDKSSQHDERFLRAALEQLEEFGVSDELQYSKLAHYFSIADDGLFFKSISLIMDIATDDDYSSAYEAYSSIVEPLMNERGYKKVYNVAIIVSFTSLLARFAFENGNIVRLHDLCGWCPADFELNTNFIEEIPLFRLFKKGKEKFLAYGNHCVDTKTVHARIKQFFLELFEEYQSEEAFSNLELFAESAAEESDNELDETALSDKPKLLRINYERPSLITSSSSETNNNLSSDWQSESENGGTSTDAYDYDTEGRDGPQGQWYQKRIPKSKPYYSSSSDESLLGTSGLDETVDEEYVD